MALLLGCMRNVLSSGGLSQLTAQQPRSAQLQLPHSAAAYSQSVSRLARRQGPVAVHCSVMQGSMSVDISQEEGQAERSRRAWGPGGRALHTWVCSHFPLDGAVPVAQIHSAPHIPAHN
jgi:hypothetical protein